MSAPGQTLKPPDMSAGLMVQPKRILGGLGERPDTPSGLMGQPIRILGRSVGGSEAMTEAALERG